MVTSSLEEREIQLLLVALRYWRAHRSEGATRHSDPTLTPDLVDRLVAKLTALLPASERPRQSALLSGDATGHAPDEPAGPDATPRPTTRR